MTFYEEIFRALQNHGVRYLILGGTAVNLHGVPRMTADLDITVDLSSENVAALIEAMEDAGMKAALPINPADLADAGHRRAWREEKHMEALTFQSGSGAPYREVDIVIEPPLEFEKMYAARSRLRAGDLSIDLVSLADLIAIKSKLGREQDLADVEALKRIEQREGEVGE